MTEVRIDSAGLSRRAGEFEFRRANYAELEAGLSLAERLTGQAMATSASIHWKRPDTGRRLVFVCLFFAASRATTTLSD